MNDESGRGQNDDDPSPRVRLEQLIPSLVKRAIAQGVEVLNDEGLRETLVADTLRRAFSKGSEVVDLTEDQVRRLVGELPITKELGDRLLQRIDDQKSEFFGLIKDEFRGFAERIDLVSEVQTILTGMTLEVNASIRFVKNETPEITSTARIETAKKKKRPSPRSSARKAAKTGGRQKKKPGTKPGD